MSGFDDLIDSVLESYEITEKENMILSPLLGELSKIYSDAVRFFARTILLNAPAAFWVAPTALRHEVHNIPPDEYEDGGSLVHVKRTFRVADTLADSWQLTESERDILFAAVLIKDVTKIDMDENGEYYYDDMFYMYSVDPFVAKVRENGVLDSNELTSSANYIGEPMLSDIMRAVRQQRGVYSPIPETIPQRDSIGMLVHLADRMAYEVHEIMEIGSEHDQVEVTKEL
jgi:hypothetical protein